MSRDLGKEHGELIEQRRKKFDPSPEKHVVKRGVDMAARYENRKTPTEEKKEAIKHPIVEKKYNEDDLTKITGLGRATAKLLKANGITSFEQIADLGDTLVSDLLINPTIGSPIK